MAKIEALLRKGWPALAALLVMLLSFLVTAPTGEMIVSLEWNGIAMVFVMTMTVAGIRKERMMESLSRSASVFSHLGSLAAFFALMSLILSPFITSAFTAAAMVPLASRMLEERERKECIPSFAAIIALAANAGGLILPPGNFGGMMLHMELGDASFLRTMLPFFIASLPVVAVSVPLLLGRKTAERTYITDSTQAEGGNKGMRMLYTCFAFIAVLSSLSLFRWVDIVIFTLAILLVFDREVFVKADYTPLLSVLFLSIAGKCLSPAVLPVLQENTLLWGTVLTEILGALPVASAGAGIGLDGTELLEAVSIGSAGTLSSLPALIALLSLKRNERLAFALRYIPFSLIMLIVFIVAVVI